MEKEIKRIPYGVHLRLTSFASISSYSLCSCFCLFCSIKNTYVRWTAQQTDRKDDPRMKTRTILAIRNIWACIIESRKVCMCMCMYRRVRSHRCSSRFDASRTILLAEEFLFSHFEQAFSAIVAWQDRFYGYPQSIWYSSGGKNSL